MSTKTTTTDTTINTTNTKNTTNNTNHPSSLLRIACLIPSATIICIELGLYDNIVGITHECIEFLLLPKQPNNNNNNNNIRILTRDGLPSSNNATTQNEIHNAIIKQSQQSQKDQQCSRTTSTTANNVIPSLYPLIQEEIEKAQPTLIITQDLCGVCAPTSNQIKDIIIKDNSNDPKNPKIISLSPKTLKDVANTFVTVADACGIKNVGIQKRNAWLNKFEKLQTTIEKNIRIDDDNNNNSNKPTSSSSRKKMLILEWLDPPFDSGHWTYDMMDCIKVDNAAAVTAVASNNNNAKNKATNKATQHKKSIQITWDDIYNKMKPTVVIVGCCGFNLQRNYEDAMKYKLELSKLQHAAARNGNILYAVNGNMYIAMPSPYLLEGTIVLALCAYQDQPSVIQAIHAAFPEYFEESSSTTTKLQWKSIDLFQDSEEEEQSSTLLTGKTSAVNKSSNSNGNNNNTTSSLPDIEDIIGAESSTDVIPKDIIGFGQLHMDACKQGLDKYIDPISGYSVFTELAHKKRGYCCGSGCRHCPFGHENIKMESKSTTIQQPSILYMAKTKTKTSTGGKGQGQDDDDDCDELFSLQQHPNITKILFFSGGKDSFLTIRQLVKDYYNCSEKSNNKFGLVLLTTFDSTTRIIAHQNVHIDQVIKQAQHLNITLVGVPLRRGSGELYVDRIEKGINIIKDKLLLSESKNNTNTNTNTNNSVLGDHNHHNHNHHNSIVLVAGDLHLEHIRNWRETTFGNNNNNKQQQQYNNKYKLEFPLWKTDYDKLMDDLELSQVPCQISAVTINNDNDNDDDDDDSLFEIKQQLKVGTIFTRELYNQLVLLKSKTTNNNIDGFGEKGEFHSLAMVWKIPRETCLGHSVFLFLHFVSSYFSCFCLFVVEVV